MKANGAPSMSHDAAFAVLGGTSARIAAQPGVAPIAAADALGEAATWGALALGDDCATDGCALSALQLRAAQRNAPLTVPGSHSGSTFCFCQMAHNPGCENTKCTCGEGCDDAVIQHKQTVSFRKYQVRLCQHDMRILTIPRTYIKHIEYAKVVCGGDARAALLLEAMLLDGFQTYQDVVARSSVTQCIHRGWDESVRWLHLHTFCKGGR
eukprot:CAMPEP_0180788674 /NCGR_PEP_ID=MMETSP1038_2-20121128/52153_1 /TAXON_ID=632150 /ORGANISM="Azadinium spinosum, Strain 3D9" /LENGTH=209 /DNA_ID=CAMNT_0022826265 /DNA_START=30 /DNA_END=657 /DNA_ORIENTATION=+